MTISIILDIPYYCQWLKYDDTSSLLLIFDLLLNILIRLASLKYKS